MAGECRLYDNFLDTSHNKGLLTFLKACDGIEVLSALTIQEDERRISP